MPYVCSSHCASREGIDLSPGWTQPGDKAAISDRLSAKDKGPSGADKGRVLYLIGSVPLGQGNRVEGVALLSVRPAKLYQLYRICFNQSLISYDRPLVASDLVQAAFELASKGDAKLHMKVPHGGDPGPLCVTFGFNGTTKDARGGLWMCQ